MKHRRSKLIGLIAIAGLAMFLLGNALNASAQAVKRGDPAKRLPKVGITPVAPAENFPVEVGQKIFTDGDAKIESVAPEMVGLTAARFPRGSKLGLGTTANVELLIGYFRADGDEWAKPPAGQQPVIRNAAKISGMPPVDVYFISLKPNGRTGAPIDLKGTFAMLGVVPGNFKVTPWDAKGGETTAGEK